MAAVGAMVSERMLALWMGRLMRKPLVSDDVILGRRGFPEMTSLISLLSTETSLPAPHAGALSKAGWSRSMWNPTVHLIPVLLYVSTVSSHSRKPVLTFLEDQQPSFCWDGNLGFELLQRLCCSLRGQDSLALAAC